MSTTLLLSREDLAQLYETTAAMTAARWGPAEQLVEFRLWLRHSYGDRTPLEVSETMRLDMIESTAQAELDKGGDMAAGRRAEYMLRRVADTRRILDGRTS